MHLKRNLPINHQAYRYQGKQTHQSAKDNPNPCKRFFIICISSWLNLFERITRMASSNMV